MLVFGFPGNNILRPDRTKDRVGIIIILRKSHTIINKLFNELYENVTLTLVINKKRSNFVFSYNPHLQVSAPFISWNYYYKELTYHVRPLYWAI